MKPYGPVAGAVLALTALGCGNDAVPANGGEAALAASADGQLAMATASGLTHRPAEAGPITVYKTPT